MNFEYEKLSLFGFVCGRLGHIEQHCEVQFSMSEDDGTRDSSNDIQADTRKYDGSGKSSKWLREEKYEGSATKEGIDGSHACENHKKEMESDVSNKPRGPLEKDAAVTFQINAHNAENQGELCAINSQSLVTKCFNHSNPPGPPLSQPPNTQINALKSMFPTHINLSQPIQIDQNNLNFILSKNVNFPNHLANTQFPSGPTKSHDPLVAFTVSPIQTGIKALAIETKQNNLTKQNNFSDGELQLQPTITPINIPSKNSLNPKPFKFKQKITNRKITLNILKF